MRRALAGAIFALLLAAGMSAASDTDEPFGLPTIEAAPQQLNAAWHQITDKLRAEKDVVGRCRAAPSSCRSPAAERLNAIIREGDSGDELARIGRINRAVNLAIKPARAGAGPTEWTSPLETLSAGTGDCKQYAVVKYAALLEAGFAADRVRLVIVRIRSSTPPPSAPADHAVIAVRVQSRWLVLDNRSLTVSDSVGLLNDLEPLFTLDHRGVRQFVSPGVAPAPASPCSDRQS